MSEEKTITLFDEFLEKTSDETLGEYIHRVNTMDVTPDESNEYIVVHGEPSLAYTTESLIAKINFTDTYYGKLFLDAIKQGQKLIIKPYGYAEHDSEGNVKNFNLIGFNICSER